MGFGTFCLNNILAVILTRIEIEDELQGTKHTVLLLAKTLNKS